MITIVAIIAAMALQGVWFGRTYKLMIERLQKDLNEMFDATARREVTYRMKKMPEETRYYPNYIENRTKLKANEAEYDITYLFSSICDSLSVPLDYAYLDSIFYTFLVEKNIEALSYKIDSVAIDTVRYRYTQDLMEDSALVCNSQMIQSHILPLNLNFTKGVQVTISHPYKKVLAEMYLFLCGTLLLFLLILFCIIRQINVIRRQNKISQLREDFSYAMIHDMKTPLSSIIMSNHTLSSGKLDGKPEVRKNFHDIIAKESEHLLVLTNKVLTISKLEHEKMKMVKSPVPIQPLIEEMIEKFKTIATKPVYFETEFKTDTVMADKEYLQEAISNLIDNALKYSRQDITICITTQEEAGYHLISIRDNGIGIPTKELPNIFNKFERASSVRSGKGKRIAGFGLGLNYVYQVMQAHGGKVSVESREGEYSEFTLYLPQS